MKTLGIETIFAAQSKNKIFWRNQPFEKISLKNICAKNRVIFWTISYCEHKKSAQLGIFKVK